MAQRVVCDISVSADGFAAGPGQTAERPFGDGPVDRLHSWMFDTPDENADEVARIVAACADLRLPVIPRGAGTGLSGGANAVAGSVVLDLSRMDRILEIDADNLIAVVQPGVVNDHLKAAVAEHGLWYPPDPASAAWSR